MDRRIATIGMVVLVVLSGCSALDVGDSGGAETDAPVGVASPDGATPTATPTETSSPTPATSDLDPVSSMDSLPPGVTEDGIADKSALLDSYRNRLNEGSYALVTDVLNSTGGDSRLVLRNDTAVTKLRVEPADRGAALELYDAAPTYGLRNGSSGAVTYGHGETSLTSQVNVVDIFVVNFGTEWLRAMEWEPVGATAVDGEQRLVFEASSLNESEAREGGLVVPPVLSEGTEAREVDARMAVTSEGLVRSANVTITADVNGSVRTAATRLSVEPVEPGSMDAPSWLSQAPSVELSAAEGGRLLSLDNTGGAAVQSGVTLSVTVGGSLVGNATVPEKIAPGQTVYLHRTGEGDTAGVSLTVGERPDLPANATAFEGRVMVTGEQGDATFQAGVDTDEE